MRKGNFQLFIEKLQKALIPPLPGAPAHEILAPEHRKTLILDSPDISQAKPSSVMILLFPDSLGDPHILFTKRVEYKGVHGGQMSFPGGKAEKADNNLYDTALRETEEELGIKRSKVSILGTLSELYVPPSNFLIFPVVGVLSGLPEMKPDYSEVEKVITMPFSFFLSKSAVGIYEVTTHEDNKFHVPGFLVDKYLIWGATAMILSELILVVKKTGLFS